GDDAVGPEDILFINAVWGKEKSSLSEEVRGLLFREGSSDSDQVGLEHLLSIAIRWQTKNE
ncbi:MAG: hypothetical protein KC978_14710, partial [Candidatus Omnitrophica bacterium]|nr:hypothetical protein [Candidatus Omnitrophota bacterium]